MDGRGGRGGRAAVGALRSCQTQTLGAAADPQGPVSQVDGFPHKNMHLGKMLSLARACLG